MEQKINEVSRGALDKAREIPRRMKSYAHNRTLPVLVNLGLFLLAAAAIAGSSTMAGSEFRAGRIPSALVFGAASLAICALWVWLVTTRRGVTILKTPSSRLYAAEGNVVAATGPCVRSRATTAVAIIFAFCMALQILGGVAFEATLQYMVPIMAAYAVPFLLFIWVRQGGMAAPFMLLWPGLFSIHAVLALAGVRPFSGDPNAVNILVPTFGYGAIAALASHVYSRVALRKLRSLARGPEADGREGRQNA